MKKQGQVTIFIIIGLVIVSAILIFFLWIKPTYISNDGTSLGFESCVSDAVEQAVENLGPNGGFIDPEFTYLYMGEEIAYLCYTSEYYKTCTIQVPFLKQNFESQAKEAIKNQVETCYSNSLDELKSQNYDVTEGEVIYEVLAEPGVIRVEIKVPTTVDTKSFSKFNVRTNSPIYEEMMIATSMLQQETGYGDTDIDKFRIYYPDYLFEKMRRSDGTTIYSIESKDYETKFRFASRSLAWPPGYG